MKHRFSAGLLLAWSAAACGHSSGGEAQGAPPPAEEAPVAINPEVPIAYPAALFDRGVDGEVKLRLFADSTGKLVAESTKVLESSGYPAMDSAALAGAPRLKFAPGRRHGLPVATAFQQTIEFRHPSSAPVAPADVGETKPLPPPVTLSTPASAAKPKPRVQRPRPADTTKVDTTRVDKTRDTTKAKPDTTKPKPDSTPPPPKPDSGPKPVRPDSNDRAH
ncbi:MAG TPA: energy transducer TonB [Gemmatimonadales bacterium]|nr:energy transducer TonB [Gemmatimonadales bacterium]